MTLLFFSSAGAVAQFWLPPGQAATKLMSKNRWAKAEEKLRKSLHREPVDPLAHYLLSIYFFSPENPDYHLDSAHHHAMSAISDFTSAGDRTREKLARMQKDSIFFITWRNRIDSALFEQVKSAHTEEAYITFLDQHPHTPYAVAATRLRDEVAYLNAVQRNTHEAFLEFLNKYPLAGHAAEARKQYERLLYESRTADKKLSSYETFLREHPATPFHAEIERNIFELFTLSGEAGRYISFMQAYPSSRFAGTARNILFHLLEEEDDTQRAGLFLTDSLRNIRRLQESFLVPFLKGRKYGLMDKNGAEVVPPVIAALPEAYKCGNIGDDILVLSGRLLARDGHVVYEGPVDAVEDLGTGFLKVTKAGCADLVHKSGLIIDRCVDDANVLGKRFLSVSKDGQWTLRSFSGRELLPESWEEIALHGRILMLKKDGQFQLLTIEQLLGFADTHKLPVSDPYDEVVPLPGGNLLVSAQQQQAVIDQDLSHEIPPGRYQLKAEFFGYAATSEEGFHFYSDKGKRSPDFRSVSIHRPWVVVSNDSLWYLFDPEGAAYRSSGYDSVAFEGPFLIGYRGDTVMVHFSETETKALTPSVDPAFVPGTDSASFLMTTADGNKTLFDRNGKELFRGAFDNIRHAGMDLFIVTKKDRKGLVDASGKVLLPFEYDAIGTVANQVISVLKGMKFGLYHVDTKKLIPAQYEKNLVPYTENLVAAYRDGFYGFVDWSTKTAGDFLFDEVTFWNDTAALVREGAYWSLYHIGAKAKLRSGIRQITPIRDTPAEKVAIVRTESAYGVWSSIRGEVIPVTFTDLVNVGSAEEPLFFTEKHVAEASVFVVIYYDSGGKFLRREIYEDAGDYEMIYCPER